MRPLTDYARPLLLASVALGPIACTPSPGTSVDVEIYAAEGVLHDGLLTQGPTDAMEVVFRNPLDTFVETFDLATGSGTVPSVPIGEDYQVTVRGFIGDGVEVQFYGASALFDVGSDDSVTVPIQVGRADCVGINRAAESRDPADNGQPTLGSRRVGASMTPLPDGRILILGGADISADGNPERVLDTAEIFDPVHNQFISLPWRLDLPRAYHTATALPDGQVLVVGGVIGVVGGELAVTERAALIDVDDPEPLRVFPIGLPAEARAYHQAVGMPDGSVLIAGGETAAGTPLASTVRFIPPEQGDPIAGRFRVQDPMHQARTRFTATRIARPADPVAVAGGLGADGPLDGVELFTINGAQGGCATGATPSSEVGCFIRPSGARMADARWGHAAVEVEDGQGVLFIGGFGTTDRDEPVAPVAHLSLQNFQVTEAGQLAVPRGDLAAVAIDDGGFSPLVLTVGGRAGDEVLPTVSRLVPRLVDDTGDGAPDRVQYVTEQVADGCSLTEGRFGLQAIQLRTRSVLLVGGALNTPGGLAGSQRVEQYFPRINSF